MKGDLKVLLTGKWDTDLYQLKNRAAKKGFTKDNIEQLAKAFGQIYSIEAAEAIAKLNMRQLRKLKHTKLSRQQTMMERKPPKS